MTEVYIVDNFAVIMLTVKFRDDQFALIRRRGWIVPDQWMVQDRTVYTMTVAHLEQYLKEVA